MAGNQRVVLNFDWVSNSNETILLFYKLPTGPMHARVSNCLSAIIYEITTREVFTSCNP